MAHSTVRNQLISLRNSTREDAWGFLEGLSPIHTVWHGPGARRYGFLLFHHRVLRYFRSNVEGPLSLGITPYSTADFSSGGMFESVPWPLPGALTGPVSSLEGLAEYSSVVEEWHNSAHGAIGAVTGAPMMDPTVNIFYRPFWRLHSFIDEEFKTALVAYGNAAHPPVGTPTSIAGHIEESHHSFVPAI
jgi:hypothetical protein